MALNGVTARDAFSVMRIAGSFPRNANAIEAVLVARCHFAVTDSAERLPVVGKKMTK